MTTRSSTTTTPKVEDADPHLAELRGSAPILSAKDVLLEVRADVKAMSRQVDILVSQQLDGRLSALETWRDRVDGRVSVIQIGLAVVGSIVALLVGVLTITKLI